MTETAVAPLAEQPNTCELSPNIPPIYAKCLTCPDYGTTCRGFDLRCLGDVNAVRAFHKAMKKSHPNITLRAIAAAAPSISGDTINEYFSNAAKNDYKWTTVIAIDNAMLTLCGNRVGLPPIDHSCPASSSEYRNQLAAADLKLAAADLNFANMQAECDDLRRRLADSDGTHVSQLSELQAVKNNEVAWFKQDLIFWRRFAFSLLGITVLLLVLLMLYVGWDIAHPASGLIQY